MKVHKKAPKRFKIDSLPLMELSFRQSSRCRYITKKDLLGILYLAIHASDFGEYPVYFDLDTFKHD